jgi:hypothetical protein
VGKRNARNKPVLLRAVSEREDLPEGNAQAEGERPRTLACHFRVNDKTATRLCIVCLRPPENKAGRAQVRGVLVHEAVHIWQRCIAVIGEHSPSDEFMAYSIQQISEELFKLYMEQKT